MSDYAVENGYLTAQEPILKVTIIVEDEAGNKLITEIPKAAEIDWRTRYGEIRVNSATQQVPVTIDRLELSLTPLRDEDFVYLTQKVELVDDTNPSSKTQ